jgi:hypothetical protein
VREQIIQALQMLGISKYQFCKENNVALSNFCAFLKGGNTLSTKKVQEILDILEKRLNTLKRWEVFIVLSNGNEVVVRISAPDGEAALHLILQQPVFRNFAAGCTISRYKFREIGKYKIDPKNFVLQESQTKGWWVVTDTRFNIVVKFQKGNFDVTKKQTILFEMNKMSELDIATSLKEITEFLLTYHSELL